MNLDSALSQLYETVAAILTNAKMYLNCTSEIKLLFLRKICENCEKGEFRAEFLERVETFDFDNPSQRHLSGFLERGLHITMMMVRQIFWV